MPHNRTRIIATLSLISLLLSNSPVKACLNDRQTQAAEEEFRSRYESPPPQFSPRPTLLGLDLWGVLATAAGSALFTYAVITTLKRKP